jgi:hypothetical protein
MLDAHTELFWEMIRLPCPSVAAVNEMPGASSRRRPSHTLAARAGLANAYHAAERLTDAATLLRDTLSRCEQELPPGNPLTQILRHTMTGLGGG